MTGREQILFLIWSFISPFEGLSKSSWLNFLETQGVSLMDSMFIQILQYKKYSTTLKLRPSYRSNTEGNDVNIYTAKQKIGDGFLPRATVQDYGLLAHAGTQTWGNGYSNVFKYHHLGGHEMVTAEPAIQISVSSLLGNLVQKDVLLNWAAEGKIREEIIKGKAYYVIPFEHKIEAFDEQGDWNNLGLVFYTFLDIPYFFSLLQEPDIGLNDLAEDHFEQLVVEGPINAEVVYINGEVQTTREAFFLPDGQDWEGSVHWHGPDNPDPTGYFGDGGLSSLDPGSPYRGWMIGEKTRFWHGTA